MAERMEQGNMSDVTVGDVVKLVQDFERRLEAMYAGLRDRATSDTVRLLAHYLARHRRHLPEAMEAMSERTFESFSEDCVGGAHTLAFSPEQCFDNANLPADVSADELLDVADRLVEHLVGLYRRVVCRQLHPGAHVLFKDLLTVEQAHLDELRKIAEMDYFK